jgi:putative tryptophan/tyrosine transport system substrate-binding protein
MRRRQLILSAGAMLAVPLAARAQQKAMPVIGYLNSGSAGASERSVAAFRQGLAETGFVAGGNVAIEFRWADGDYHRLAELAADLARRNVSVILATNLPSALAARQATAAIPIVFQIGDDPVKHGLAASLNRPGGNATGISMLAADLNEKRLGFLRELVPNARLIALLVNPGNPNVETQLAEVTEAGRAVRQRIEVFRAGSEPEIEAAFAALVERDAGGLIVGADPYLNSRRAQLVALAARHAIPAIYEWREIAELGGLMSYGTDLFQVNRQIGVYAGKILAGAKPADLPIAQPTKFALVINLKVAKALGISVPPVLLVQADEVIE